MTSYIRNKKYDIYIVYAYIMYGCIYIYIYMFIIIYFFFVAFIFNRKVVFTQKCFVTDYVVDRCQFPKLSNFENLDSVSEEILTTATKYYQRPCAYQCIKIINFFHLILFLLVSIN